MAKFDFGGNSPQNNPPQVQQNPSQTPISNLNKITVDELLKKLNGNTNPQLKQIQDKLTSSAFQNITSTHKEQLESVLGQYSYLDNKATSGTLLMLLSDIENLEIQFQEDVKKIQADSEKSRLAIFPTEYLDEVDFQISDSIKKKLGEVDTMFVNQKMDNKMLADRILSIKLKGSNIEKSDWDSFFTDLRNAIDQKDLIDFDKAVSEFKKSNILYLKSSGDYKSDRTITKTGIPGVIQKGTNVILDTYDNAIGIGGLDIENIGTKLDARTHEILALSDTNDQIVVDIGGGQCVFQSKEIALKSIYKVKLILDELSKDNSFMMSIHFLSNMLGLDGIIGTILSTTIQLAVGGYLVFTPLESMSRNIKDVISIRLGDKGWSEPLQKLGSFIKGIDGGLKNQNIPYIGNILKVLRLGTIPLSYATNLTSSLLSSAEKGTLESMLRDEKVTVVDGLFQYNKNETDNKFEMKQRVKILDFYKKKWKDDPERLSKLDSLTNPRKLVMGGQINSLTETFYLKIWEIDKGQLILTNKGIGLKEKAQNVGKGALLQTGHVFTIPNYKEKIFKEVNDGLLNQIEAIKEVYEVKDLGDGKIEIGELNSFYNDLKTAVDLDGTIDNADETKRNKLAEEYIKRLKSLDIQGITKERVRQDLVLISEGYLPKYKILEKLKIEINRAGLSDDVKKNIQKLIDKVSEGNWIGKESELNTEIANANGSSYSCVDKLKPRSNQQIEDRLKAGKSLLKLRFSLDDHSIKTEAEFISFFDNELKITKMLKDLSSTESINDELRKLFKDMKGGNDYTKGHLNYIVQKLLGGETYDNAKTKLSVADFANIDNTHGDKIVLARAIRDNLLTKMETELGTIETEADINLKEKKLKEFKKKYEITGELETFMKSEGKKYDDILSRLDKTEKELEKVKFSFETHNIKSETEFIKSFEGELEILKMLKGIDSTRDIEVEMKKLYADISSGNNKTITHLNYIIHELLDGKDYDTVKTSIPTTVDSTHGDREKLKGELGDKLLVEMETQLGEIEKINPILNPKSLLTKILTLLNDVNSNIILNPNIDINNELKKIIDSELPGSNNNRLFKMLESVINPTIGPRLMSIDKIESEINLILEGETINSKSNKIKEYNKRFEINGELQAYLKTLGGKYSTILSKLDKINSTLSLDLKTFVEFDDSGEFKGKAKELVDKAILVSPGSSDVIEALKTKIDLENNKITLVQFENILKGIVIKLTNGNLGIRDIQSLDFNDYTDETKLSTEAKKIKLSDIKTTPLTIQGHGLDTTSEYTISYANNAGIEELIREWNSYVEKEKTLESQIQQLEHINDLKNQVNDYDFKIKELNIDKKFLLDEIERKQKENLGLSNTKQDQIKKDRLNNEINLLSTQKERMREEIKDIETNKIALEKEIREIQSKLPRGADLIKYEEDLKNLKDSFGEAVEKSPIYKKSKILKGKPYSIDLFKEFLKEVKSGKLIR